MSSRESAGEEERCHHTCPNNTRAKTCGSHWSRTHYRLATLATQPHGPRERAQRIQAPAYEASHHECWAPVPVVATDMRCRSGSVGGWLVARQPAHRDDRRPHRISKRAPRVRQSSCKALWLASWRDQAALEAWQKRHPQAARGPAEAMVRRRTVRIIRDYGMFDRREAPQYYPPVDRRT
jgi:hypothetical protein